MYKSARWFIPSILQIEIISKPKDKTTINLKI